MTRRWARPTLMVSVGERMKQLGYDNILAYPVDPFGIACKEGILVVMRPISDHDFCGVLFTDEYGTLILLNSNTPDRHALTIMRDLIHLWFHPCPELCLGGIQANNGAANEALMPAQLVKEEALSSGNDVATTARTFGVSWETMRARFAELDLHR